MASESLGQRAWHIATYLVYNKHRRALANVPGIEKDRLRNSITDAMDRWAATVLREEAAHLPELIRGCMEKMTDKEAQP